MFLDCCNRLLAFRFFFSYHSYALKHQAKFLVCENLLNQFLILHDDANKRTRKTNQYSQSLLLELFNVKLNV